MPALRFCFFNVSNFCQPFSRFRGLPHRERRRGKGWGGMPNQTEFTILYQRLLLYVEPDPGQSAAELQSILRQLADGKLPKSADFLWKAADCCDMIE